MKIFGVLNFSSAFQYGLVERSVSKSTSELAHSKLYSLSDIGDGEFIRLRIEKDKTGCEKGTLFRL